MALQLQHLWHFNSDICGTSIAPFTVPLQLGHLLTSFGLAFAYNRSYFYFTQDFGLAWAYLFMNTWDKLPHKEVRNIPLKTHFGGSKL